jgi:outer membrane protein
MKIGKTAFIAITIVFFFAVCAYSADVAKIGIIDFQKIFDTSSTGKSAQAEITEKGKKMEAELKEKGAVIEKLQKKLEHDSLVMSKEMREEKTREIQIKIGEIKALQKKYLTEFRGLESRLVTRIKKDVLEIVKELGKKKGYLLIMEKNAALYYPDSIDLTDQIIRTYNKKQADKKK